MIVITLLFGVFYLVDLQRPISRYEPYDPRFAALVEHTNVSKSCANAQKMKDDELHPLEKSVPLYIITATYPRLEQLGKCFVRKRTL